MEKFGTEMFEWSSERLLRETQEEISDARNYILAKIYKEVYAGK